MKKAGDSKQSRISISMRPRFICRAMFLFVVWASLLLICSSSKAENNQLELKDVPADKAFEILKTIINEKEEA
jgi:hypothetical protein